MIIVSNCSQNVKYLIECVYPGFNISKYKKDISFPGVTISKSSLQRLLSSKAVSEKTIRMIASSFTLYLKDSISNCITVEDINNGPAAFKEKFPITCFKMQNVDNELYDLGKYTNKLYRCYYMITHSPYQAYGGFFKLFFSNGMYFAYMIRGINDFFKVDEIKNCFDNPNKIKQMFFAYKENMTGKYAESIHLYYAGDDNIDITRECIKIDFYSIEEDPCRTTMFWNVSISNKINPNKYIGGSALVVDTNDGRRGKDICAFKMGLEAIENTSNDLKNADPINISSSLLINELSIQPKNGVMILDNSDDSRWFRFLQEPINRNNKNFTYAYTDVQRLINSIAVLQKKMDKLENIISTQLTKDN